ncbi:hypothetical protein [Kitasatospora purpeofusca]|uniref:hypothetical protein n=1 Tax=Kitasatospora purpeofusca TaxID=67352 RepID=UPI002A5A7F6D|nr:hypothetical protein [Kitasatospora purpeofusca]MDY0811471.1 hypothetical protein [Kitasatospora purpeofusca]
MSAPAAPARSGAPWVIVREGEKLLDPAVLLTATGVRYQDEGPYDRDEAGVLWARWGGRPTGRPRLGDAHGPRQRRALRQLLCQGCKQPADRTADGTLWLIEDDPQGGDAWPEQLLTMHPPTCQPCADIADRYCPHLGATGSALLRVRHAEPAGVRGFLHQARPGAPASRTRTDFVDFRYPLVRFVVAVHLVVALEGCTIIRRTPPRTCDTNPR